MTVYVLAAGRVTGAGLRDACEDYATRVNRFVRLVVREVRAGAAHASPAVRARVEGERLLAALPRGARAIALTRSGQPETSESLARMLAAWRARGTDVAFLIGGAYGLPGHVLQRCDARMSLSSLTLPHEMARLVLLEQLYRATTIIQGTPYHKGR
ncbi:MAG TPA: 23S rRNA (pseudouridine(1915)-N(3))-methyltransferase RlmH [Gemmatimonadales bacterium]|nr:23S rRNA (pseudouridine(1915)-N(3))-methyltransferase RlmH [Gemmatimonadales bacterium]